MIINYVVDAILWIIKAIFMSGKSTTQPALPVAMPTAPIADKLTPAMVPGPIASAGTILSIVKLQSVYPRLPLAKAQEYYPYLISALKEFEINTKLRIAAFLGQVGEESFQLHYMEEEASGIEYEGRKDLGNIHPGDGPLFKGRGPIQLTGRSNYELYGAALGADFINHPELASTNQYAFRVAGLYWSEHKLNALADVSNFREITHKINGGYNGYDNRLQYYTKALAVL